METGHDVRTYLNLIDGEWVQSAGGVTESVNPATGEAVARAQDSGPADAGAAVDAARSAFDEGTWSGKKPNERERLLHSLAESLRAHIEALSLILTLENGKPLADARGEVLNASNVFDYYASASRHLVGKIPRYGASDVSLVVHEPVGVCGLIVPWNSPISLLSWKLAPALAAGCTAVVKPSTYTPAVTMEFARLLLSEEGLPRGVVNFVTGSGETVGSEIVRSPKVDKVSFTGSSATGRRIMEGASSNLKKVNLECGGKSAAIVFDDANMDVAVPGAVWSIFRSAGQSCNAGSRLLVQDTVYESFMAKYMAFVKRIRVGNGLDPDTEVGPIISEKQMNSILSYIRSGVEQGATLSAGGDRLMDENHAKGFFIAPTVFENVGTQTRIFQEEIFGPVLCALPFHDEDEAISLANATTYGLAGDIWSRNVIRILRVSQGVRTGTLWVNRHLNPGPEVPFGGYKQSGVGRETGMEGLMEYVQKHISLQLTDSYERVRR